MVKARQMEDAVEGKDFDFNGGRMAEARGIFGGDIGGDRDVASEAWSASLRFGRILRRKRQDVRGFVLIAKTAIQRADGGAGGYENVDVATQSSVATGARDKARESCLAQTCDFFLENHHFSFQ